MRLTCLDPNEPNRPGSQVILQPLTYQPTHRRDESDASSVYTDKRTSTYHYRSASNDSINYSLPYQPSRTSTAYPTNEQGRLSVSSSLQAPGSAQGSTTESRLSEFYDAYYRQSTLFVPPKTEGKRPNQLTLAPPTIVEVPTPDGSPMPTPQSPRRPDELFGRAM
jgi:hypothetical protein